jgi:hypothetical protein
MIQEEDIVKFIKSLRLIWYGHVEIMYKQIMPKQMATSTMEGQRKEEDHVKDGETKLKRTKWNGNEIRQAMAKDRRKWRNNISDANTHNGL